MTMRVAWRQEPPTTIRNSKSGSSILRLPSVHQCQHNIHFGALQFRQWCIGLFIFFCGSNLWRHHQMASTRVCLSICLVAIFLCRHLLIEFGSISQKDVFSALLFCFCVRSICTVVGTAASLVHRSDQPPRHRHHCHSQLLCITQMSLAKALNLEPISL